ncbi:MAG: DUF2125 domain-containing protein [Paracoccus sp. (in: a-proteobacteria)]|nr:DUF2125 domain-containing protein [Paracoccus sp. (in: a-proteobacteria)]
MGRTLATSTLALIIGAGTALADLSPAAVWENVERSLVDGGSTVEIGAREESANRLVLDDVTVRQEAEGSESFKMTFPRMVFEQIDGGQVRSVIEGDTLFTMRGTDIKGEATSFDAVLEMPGNETVSSGSIEDMRHIYRIPSLRLTGNVTDSETDAPLVVTMTEVRGDQTTRLQDGGGNTQGYDLSAETMELSFNATMPATDETEAEGAAPERVATSLRIEGLGMTGTGASPGGGLTLDSDAGAALRAGLSFEGRVESGPISGTFASDQGDETGERQSSSGTFALEAAALDLALSASGIIFGSTASNMAVELTDSNMGAPVSYQVADAKARVNMPLLADEAEQPFSLVYSLDGIMLDETTWAMMDPESSLPRDPASLAIDLDGTLMLRADLVDPEAGMEGEPPFQPRRLNVNRFAIDAVGASALAEGALTFGEDVTRPVGTLNADVTGLNTLLDTLVSMGLMPADQVMGARMMIAMFARPVDGDQNRLRTELEFRENGSIFANGQQIQ